jgi:catalase
MKLGIKSIVAMSLVGAGLAVASFRATAEEATGDNLVDGLNAIFGDHAGRAAHAKGQCVKGKFTPAADAAALSKSPMFAAPASLLGRFSFGGGNPNAGEKEHGNRGFAMRFDPDGKAPVDFVQINAPIFFAKSPEQALEFFRVRAGAGQGKADVDKIKAFSAANPETTKQDAYYGAQAIPASFAGQSYWGVHAFIATNAKGATTTIKFKTVPNAGVLTLTDDEAKAKPDDFFSADLKNRLAKGPVTFKLTAIIGEKGDPTGDPTTEWPEADRKQVTLGEISVEALEDNAKCDATTLDPNNLADGLAGSPDDTVLPMRSQAYASSLSRRTAP